MHFTLPPTKGAVHVPATALMFRDEGPMVATVDASNHVKMKVITIRRDWVRRWKSARAFP